VIYEEPYTIPFFLGTQKGNVNLAMMVNALLMGSEHQLDAAGAGMDALLAHGLGWVITQYELAIKRMPAVETQVILGTQARSYNKLMTYRDYWLATPAGERLVTMRGAWVMMDLQTRQLAPILPAFPEKVGAQFATHVQRFKRLPKLDRIDVDIPYRVRYFDIDGNGHVNNVHYFEWMEDSLGADFLQAHELTGVRIKYAREVTYGSTPHAQVQREGLVTRHQIVTAGAINAEAEMTWRTRQA
jgi:medium-chain acyl-[acyl-carrier-protein] hydrolase